MTRFNLKSDFSPQGSQPDAIKSLVESIGHKNRFQTLMGVTGSGKTFTIANVIAAVQKPTLVLAHNKTLAAQLYNEFRDFFPENRVEYFVSYYDYYQPESYIPQRDIYIEKDAAINPKIEQMRLAATASLLSRDDVIVIASVSAIYGLGNPENFEGLGFEVAQGERVKRNDILSRLIEIQYERNDIELQPGRFRVKGDTIDLIPGYGPDIIRIEFFGDEIERITEIDKITHTQKQVLPYFFIYPARHYVIPEEEKAGAIIEIQKELEATLPTLGLIEAHRLRQRTLYDIEMIEETGYCKGIENYSRFFDHRQKGEKPFCLLDYFPDDFLMVIDESHQTLPQVRGMYNGDFSRKKSLVEYGFRLPSAFDNRPLKFPEFEDYMRTAIFVSATPGPYEKEHSSAIIEQIIRPTGLVDPEVSIRPLKTQIPDVCEEIQKTIAAGDRVLITTLTKKLAEELSEYLAEKGIKTRYLHSEINAIERTEILRELRLGIFDVLVGINLLREGLDIPEVSFIGILDADKEGFLRDARSLIQTIGRAARNDHSHVVLYADKITDSIKTAVEETGRRRAMQMEYNRVHGISPVTIHKPIREKEVDIQDTKHIPRYELPNLIIQVETEMQEAAERLDFERAIVLRDKLKKLNAEVQKG
ncbi:excinuclease ABC subunit UvrB [Methanogenium sp. S4BF]|uniref:excinuclease ABC subunit UvrB n=1 Tax=Methanogenium sp. S4BF TaxID=1789226 RepID=UPI0024180564|nr:excinuclease ABC subunit UvrB [Methanogenium sp. S4BF]WFN35210.1 excinuclease ABC subunit UvrB [Methanogenium sp. S4BF]